MISALSMEVTEALRQVAGRDTPEQIAELLYRSADRISADGITALVLGCIAFRLHSLLHPPSRDSHTLH